MVRTGNVMKATEYFHMEGDNLSSLLERLRAQGVSKFSCEGLSVEFAATAYLKNPLTDNSYKHENSPPSKRDEAKENDDILFHSTPFVGG